MVEAALAAGAFLLAAGGLIQRLKSHEELDRVRFEALQATADEIKRDVKELIKER